MYRNNHIAIESIIEKLKMFKFKGLENKDLDFMLKNRVIPYYLDSGSIFLCSDKYDNNLISNIEYIMGKEAKLNILSKNEVDYLLKEFTIRVSSPKLELFNWDLGDIENTEVINYLNNLIETSIRDSITDIHIEPYKENIRVRTRINGTLLVRDYLSKSTYSIIITRLKILSKLDISERRLPQDGRVNFTYLNKEIDLRISFIPTINGEKITIRILDSENKYSNLNKLGLSDENINYLKQQSNKINGMILVCGPTNSGKTTTIYAILNEINREDINIITLEDPVEYKLYGINQIQVNNKQGLMFNNVLRNILRADPEVISIGEIRDEETAETALRAAITGHFILSTVHSKDTISTIFRLKNMKVENYLISSALNTIISQRLVRILCEDCKILSQDKSPIDGIHSHYKAVGCPKCQGGYIGRKGIFEILIINDEIIEIINNNGSYHDIFIAAKSNGFRTLKDLLVDEVIKGNTSLDEILKIV